MRNKISVSKNQNNCLLSNRINSLSHKHVSSNLSYSVIYCFLWFFKFWVIVLKIIIKNLQITNIILSTINETQRLHISFYFYMVRQLILRLWSYWLDFTLFTIKWSFMNLSTTKNWKKKSLTNLELGKQLPYILFYDSNVHYLHHGFYMYIHKVNITHTA